MKTQTVVVAALLSVPSDHIASAGGTCSSLDGTHYCTCEYDKKCVSSENACDCMSYSNSSPLPAIRPAPKDLSRGRPLTVPPQSIVGQPKPSPPVDHETPYDYMRLAEAAVLGGDVDNAIVLIDKARTGLLDRSAATNKFDPALYEMIKYLTTAKQLLLAKDYTGSLHLLDTALASIN
jgi:hypothetical protein